MERGFNGKMIRKQMLRTREHSRKASFKSEKAQTSEPKLTFNITYYPVFQNIENILQELHLLLAPDKEHKKVFLDAHVVRFRNGKSLKDYSRVPNNRPPPIVNFRFFSTKDIFIQPPPIITFQSFLLTFLSANSHFHHSPS